MIIMVAGEFPARGVTGHSAGQPSSKPAGARGAQCLGMLPAEGSNSRLRPLRIQTLPGAGQGEVQQPRVHPSFRPVFPLLFLLQSSRTRAL